MIISCCWIYAISKYGYPPSLKNTYRALKDMRDMGFRYMELEGFKTENTRCIFDHRFELKRFCDDLDIHLLNFSPILPELLAEDPDIRERGMDDFKRSLEIAEHIGAQSVQVDSFTPPLTFKSPKPYTGNTFEYDQVYEVEIDYEFSYPKFYDHLVEVFKQCAILAKAAGKKLIVEPRVGENIYSTDSFLRLYEHVAENNFGVVLDAAHLNAAKEILPYSVEKLGTHIFSVHAADNDGRSNVHLQVGKGTIDWEGVLVALKKHGFSGYIALDVANVPEIDQAYRNSRDYLQAAMDRQGIVCEY